MEDNRKINEDEDKVDWVMCIHKVLDAKLAPDFDLLVDDVRKAQTEAVQRLQEVFTQLQTELEGKFHCSLIQGNRENLLTAISRMPRVCGNARLLRLCHRQL